jgi:chemotaxis protein MotB
MDVENFRTALGSVREAFGVQFKVNGRFESLSDSPISLSNVQSTDVLHRERPIEREAIGLVREFLAARGLDGSVEVDSGARGIVLRTKDQVLFDPGAAIIKEVGKPVLEAMRDLADSFDGQLAVEGHTDDRPIQTPFFPSNWELSGARSSAVLRYLLEADVDPALVHVAGYADMRPVASNDTP